MDNTLNKNSLKKGDFWKLDFMSFGVFLHAESYSYAKFKVSNSCRSV